jgi:catechol 2,3-dioxygenase-like lactoylglutathione lyase family enzyme
VKLTLGRIILFTRQLDAMTSFYRDVLGLKLVTDEKGWRELEAGRVRIGLHSGPPSPGSKGPKIAFFAADVEGARAELVARGARFGKVKVGQYTLCDGKDPDGNPIQLSNR